MLKKFYLLVIGLMIMSTDLFATHYMGGEITWECLPNGNYRFIMKTYRECYTATGGSAATFGATETLDTDAPGYPNGIRLTRISLIDISPQCNLDTFFDNSKIYCPGMTNGAPLLGAQQENVYTSDTDYPNGVNLNGVPPPTGWMFYYDMCCRNPSTNVVNSGTESARLRAIMYPYNNQNAYPCFDNSPRFEERPAVVIPLGYPFSYNHLAVDKELDSLAYKWAHPLKRTGLPVVFVNASPPIGSYAYNSPLPGTTQHPNNVPATVNPITGEISFTAISPQGGFVTVIKVEAWKCGVKVAEIFRDIEVVLGLLQPSNNPPIVTPPFMDSTGQYTEYIDTVYAGERVCFNIYAIDPEFLPNGRGQTVSLTASGLQYGANYTSTTTGCQNPPCATLSPPPPINNPFGLSSEFCWQTTCDHLATNAGCGKKTSVYNFAFRLSDDYCPIPAISFKTVTIVVRPKPLLPAPSLRCLRVDNNGDVTLTWEPIVDTLNTFNSYHLYWSNSPTGPFALLDSIMNINTDTYTHTGANANNQVVYYYFKTKAGCPGYESYSAPGDTMQTMLLDVVNTGNGTASLSWNAIKTPLLPSSSGRYIIYREYPAGNWTILDSTTSLQYVDTITLCSAFINYRIELYDSLGCWSVSSIDGDLFEDVIAPELTVLDSVSVDYGTQKAILGWNENISEDTEGYYIFHFNGTIWEKIDSVYGIDSTSYMDMVNDPISGSQSYRIAAFDSCGNTSPMGLDHQTIHLQGVLDVCDDAITLSWTPYKNMDSAVAGYHIWVSENGSPFALLASNTSTADNYEHYGLSNGSHYCYYIQAYNTDSTITSSSNEICFLVEKQSQPQFAYLRYATVKNNSYVELYGYVDTAAYVSKYKIYRSESPLGPWQLLISLPQDTIPYVNYKDVTARVQDQSYYYKIDVADSCGIDVLTSNIARSILLEATVNEDFTNTLIWNEYEDWLGGVNSYNIYRTIDGILNPVPVATVGFGITNYVDDLTGFSRTGGRFKYFVEAVEGFGNPYMFIDSSYSNEVEAIQPPRLYVPNAFAPRGYNNKFAPVGVFMSSDDYYFAVYNRWGALVYETKKLGDGWDGKYKGDYVQPGVYIYYVKFRTLSGKVYEKRGSVSLIY